MHDIVNRERVLGSVTINMIFILQQQKANHAQNSVQISPFILRHKTYKYPFVF